VVTHERIWRVSFSPDGSLLATSSGQNGLGSPHGSTILWSTRDWSQVATIDCTTFDSAFSPNGGTLALACWLDARLVSTKDSSVTTLPLASGTLAMAVAWSPDGSKVAVGGFIAGAQVFSAAGQAIAMFGDGKALPTLKALAWSPDGKWLAGGGWDDSIVRLWPSP
jgi:WD40 repeat protein